MNGVFILGVAAAVAVGLAGCDGGGDGAGTDSTSRFERGMERVGEQIETAAKGVGTEVSEARIQMIIDNIQGMDSVQAEITGKGSVTLIGSVASETVRTEAERLVRSIEGVTSVQNAIVVGAGGDTTLIAPSTTTGMGGDTAVGDTVGTGR